jgi:hypothetical protein
MKGGSLSISTNLNLSRFLNSVTNVNDLGVNSGGGYLFRVSINPSDYLTYIKPGINNMVSPATSVLLKICQIGPRDTRINGKEVFPIATFANEVNTQQIIHDKSFDLWCEPICPKILFHIKLSNDRRNILHTFLNTYARAIFNIYQSYQGDITDLGFIFMEDIGGYAVERMFPNWQQITPVTSNRTDQQITVLSNYTYQLVRLAKLGYTHGDTHLSNALFYENYDYIDNYRVILIDFGRTKKIHHRETEPYSADVIAYTFPSLENNFRGYWSYLELNDFIKKEVGRNSRAVHEWYTTINRTKIQLSRRNFYERLLINNNASMLQRLVTRGHNLDIFETYNLFDTFGYKYLHLDLNTIKNIRIPSFMGLDGCTYNFRLHNQYQLYSYNDPETKRIYDYYKTSKIIYKSSDFYTTDFKRRYPDESFMIFLWCIGIPESSNRPEFVFIPVFNSYQVASGFHFLFLHFKITKLFCAGQLIKFKPNGSNNVLLSFNLYSDGIMERRIQNGNLTQEKLTELRNNRLMPILKQFINNRRDLMTQQTQADGIRSNYNFHIQNSDTTFIRRQFFCDQLLTDRVFYDGLKLNIDHIRSYMLTQKQFMEALIRGPHGFRNLFIAPVNGGRNVNIKPGLITNNNIIKKKLTQTTISNTNNKSIDMKMGYFNLPPLDDEYNMKVDEYKKQIMGLDIENTHITETDDFNNKQLEEIKKTNNVKLMDMINLLDSYATENTNNVFIVSELNKSDSKNKQKAGKHYKTISKGKIKKKSKQTKKKQ